MAREGLDPSAEWKRARTPLPSFEVAARQYHAKVKSGWRNPKHRDQWINTLQTYAFPSLGKLPVDRIDAPDIQNVLIPIWQEVPETARRVRQRIGAVLDYAQGQGWRETEAPMRAVNSLMKAIKQPKRGNFAAMAYQQIPEFMAKLRSQPPSIGRTALQFLILTAARSGEVRGATWAEIDLEKAQWDVPAVRMKAGDAHSVPLSPAAVELLRQVKSLASNKTAALLFPGLKRKPLSDMTLTKALKAAGHAELTVHGFRSGFRDWVADCTAYPGDWAEAALAHTVPNKVEAAYRRTKYLDQRRKLMEDWSKFVTAEMADSEPR